jgi:hypothetical protein
LLILYFKIVKAPLPPEGRVEKFCCALYTWNFIFNWKCAPWRIFGSIGVYDSHSQGEIVGAQEHIQLPSILIQNVDLQQENVLLHTRSERSPNDVNESIQTPVDLPNF